MVKDTVAAVVGPVLVVLLIGAWSLVAGAFLLDSAARRALRRLRS